MAEQDQAGEKTEEPSQHKIDEARKKGDVASSKELNSVLILAGCFSVLVMSTMYVYEAFALHITWLYGLDISKAYTEEMGARILRESLWVCVKAAGPVLLTSAAMGIIAQVAQVGILFSTEVLEVKFARVNPLAGLKRIFSKKAIVEVIKGIFKFSIVMTITYSVLSDNMSGFIGFLHTGQGEALEYGKIFCLKLGMSIFVGLILVAALDFAWEKYAYKEKLRMTKQDVKEELKQREGNQEIKQKIRQIQREMSQKRMMADIPTADVIITNPTHISIVVKYDIETMVSPQIVGKGQDHLAMRIREIAKENDIPIVENVPLARALYKTVKVGEGVPRSLYKAVAEILAFIYKLKRKKKALG